ncbi:MAG TPA: hypothetical protein PKH58_01350 [Paludibacteraceae bacterium]|nr:hypothetical protein [Paludibacteraceae bacterium]
MIDLTKAVNNNKFLRELYGIFASVTGYAPLKAQSVNSLGNTNSGVCGGCVSVTTSETAFDYPSFIECTGNDGTIDYTDEYGNVVAGYPMTQGKTTNFRVNKVTAATATGLYRCYAK